MTEGLSQKQKRFGREYMVDFNVADAYVRAGYSKNGAQSGGSRLLRDSRIQAYIAELEAEATERAQAVSDRLLRETRIVFFPGEAFLLGCCDDFTVTNQTGGRIVVEC